MLMLCKYYYILLKNILYMISMLLYVILILYNVVEVAIARQSLLPKISQNLSLPCLCSYMFYHCIVENLKLVPRSCICGVILPI